MEAYVVSARKYRPSRFEEVVGQSHVTGTLEKAIKSDHLAQALLFTGPRGVGKTSCARILARMINEEGGMEGSNDFSFNIFELDAASNNSVDDIRSLIEQVRFAPQNGKFKVYIIDEVHMLSQAAFNAFLKTLEEPPAHAIFILATTEKHKIIPTILSRCQIYDFRRIGVTDIVGHLKNVARSEGIEADESALHLIAEKADGALRDALSIFDRMATFGGQKILHETVLTNLRILDHALYFQVTEAALANDHRQLLLLFAEILDKGFDGHLFLNGLAAHLRDLMVASDQATIGLLEKSQELKANYAQQGALIDAAILTEGLQLLSEADARYRNSSNARLLVELSLLKLGEILSDKKKSPDPRPVTQESAKAIPPPKPTPVAENKEPAPAVREKTAEKAPEISKADRPLEAPAPVPPVVAEAQQDPTEKPPAPPTEEKVENRQVLRKKKSRLDLTAEAKESLGPDDNDSDGDSTSSAFELDLLLGKWKELCDQFRSSNPNAASILSGIEPLKNAEGNIELSVGSQTARNILQSIRTDMTSWLKGQLRLKDLRLELIVSEEEQEKKPYFREEVHEHFVQENPAINELMDKMKLKLK